MALWMTVGEVGIGLAALLLVFSCAFLCDGFRTRSRGKDGGRRPALFRIIIMIWLGMSVGAIRTEFEEWMVDAERETLVELSDRELWMTGQVTEIREMDYGVRLLICDCELYLDPLDETESKEKEGNVRKMYAYTDSAENLCLGRKIAVWGTCELPEADRNPGGFDYRLYCLSKGIGGIFRVSDLISVQEFSDGRVSVSRCGTCYWAFQEMIRRINRMFERKLEEIAEPEDLGILKAILLGNKTDVEEELYELYRRNGIAHVLAISGLHVSVIGMGIWKGLRRLGVGYLEAGSIAFAILFAYGIMTGFGPSVVRAVFMMGVSFAADVLGRTYDLPSAMCVPAMGLLLWQPYLLTQASFQLSFLAVGAMFVPGNVLAQKWELNGISKEAWVSISLQVVTLPFVLIHSFEIPLFGIFVNVLVVPMMSYLLVSGILGVAGSFIWNGLGIILLGGAHWILKLYQELCCAIQKIPKANLVLGAPDGWEVFVYCSLIFLGTWLAFRYGRRWLALWGMGFLLLLPWPQAGISVTVLDVGQGDGIFLEADGKTMIVDCGSSQQGNVAEDILIPFLKSKGVGHLDAVVITHGDRDHISGIEELMENEECGISIGQLIISEVGWEDSVCMELVDVAKEREIPITYCKAGDVLTGILGEKARIICLHPLSDKTIVREAGADRNSDSVVLHVSYENFSMLLTGDIGIDEELVLMERYELDPVTVLKAAHHGSANSNSREFLETVRPAYVVFSYGEGNSYGHPAPKVVELCEEIGARVYGTARSGAVIIWTDGIHLQVDGWLDRQDGI